MPSFKAGLLLAHKSNISGMSFLPPPMTNNYSVAVSVSKPCWSYRFDDCSEIEHFQLRAAFPLATYVAAKRLIWLCVSQRHGNGIDKGCILWNKIYLLFLLDLLTGNSKHLHRNVLIACIV